MLRGLLRSCVVYLLWCQICVHTGDNYQLFFFFFSLLDDCEISHWLPLKPQFCMHLPFPLVVPLFSEHGISLNKMLVSLAGADCKAHSCRKLCVYFDTISLKLSSQLGWLPLAMNTQEKLQLTGMSTTRSVLDRCKLLCPSAVDCGPLKLWGKCYPVCLVSCW